MKYTRYGRYTGEPADSVDLQELMKRLSDFLLQSGFESQFYGISEMDPERSMANLRQAILRALQEGDLLPDDELSEEMRELLQNPDALTNQQVRDLIDQLVERLTQEGYISPQPPQVTPPPEQTPRGHLGGPNDRETHARFEITDKTLDFLGFKTLKDLLASPARAASGATTRATWPPESNPAASRGNTNSATR